MKQSKTDYRGGEAIVLSTDTLELTVTTSVGPRITSLRSLIAKGKGAGQNLFLEIPATAQAFDALKTAVEKWVKGLR